MRHIAPAAAALLLAGCYTEQVLQRQTPDARYSSQKTIPVLSQCISSRMAAQGRVSVDRDDAVTRLTLIAGNGYPAAIVYLRPSAHGGTNITVRQAISYSLRGAVESCL